LFVIFLVLTFVILYEFFRHNRTIDHSSKIVLHLYITNSNGTKSPQNFNILLLSATNIHLYRHKRLEQLFIHSYSGNHIRSTFIGVCHLLWMLSIQINRS